MRRAGEEASSAEHPPRPPVLLLRLLLFLLGTAPSTCVAPTPPAPPPPLAPPRLAAIFAHLAQEIGADCGGLAPRLSRRVQVHQLLPHHAPPAEDLHRVAKASLRLLVLSQGAHELAGRDGRVAEALPVDAGEHEPRARAASVQPPFDQTLLRARVGRLQRPVRVLVAEGERGRRRGRRAIEVRLSRRPGGALFVPAVKGEHLGLAEQRLHAQQRVELLRDPCRTLRRVGRREQVLSSRRERKFLHCRVVAAFASVEARDAMPGSLLPRQRLGVLWPQGEHERAGVLGAKAAPKLQQRLRSVRETRQPQDLRCRVAQRSHNRRCLVPERCGLAKVFPHECCVCSLLLRRRVLNRLLQS